MLSMRPPTASAATAAGHIITNRANRFRWAMLRCLGAPRARTRKLIDDAADLAPLPRLRTSVDIVHANDVVLAQIRPGLDLDEVERNAPRVLQAVHAS